MMQLVMNRSRMFGLMLALALCVAVPAMAQVEFTFEGFAAFDPGTEMQGATMTVYGIANPPMSVPTPVPTDFAANQYTVAIGGMLTAGYAFDGINFTKSYMFTGGTISIYEDAIAGGTAGDYANPSTFVDGSLLLQASVDDGWSMDLNNASYPFGWFSGAGIGTCDMNGGSALSDLIGMNYPLIDWTFAGTGISEPMVPFITVPAGYDYVFGTKIIFPYNPTATEGKSWGEVKTLFR